MVFQLDPQLAADSEPIAKLKLSQLRLINDRRYVWLVLIPQRMGACELLDLSRNDRFALMDEIALISRLLRDEFAPDKINVGALGNIVSQLHIHVIARYKTDPALPGPVWGQGEVDVYDRDALAPTLDRIERALERISSGENM